MPVFPLPRIRSCPRPTNPSPDQVEERLPTQVSRAERDSGRGWAAGPDPSSSSSRLPSRLDCAWLSCPRDLGWDSSRRPGWQRGDGLAGAVTSGLRGRGGVHALSPPR